MNQTPLTPRVNAAGYPLADGIFGVNVEITRRGFFGGLSAQMLNNRKLFAGADAPAGWDCEGFERVTDRPGESLCHSSFVILKNGTMSQTSEDIALRKGRTYEAAVWVRACAELRTGAYSFESNDFEVAENAAHTVHGHSVLFCKLMTK